MFRVRYVVFFFEMIFRKILKKMKHYFRHTYVYHYHHAHINHSSNMLTTWRDIPLTLARAFGKRFRPSVANVEGIWEYIILPGAGK